MKCKCGCGQDCQNEYVHGHNRKGRKISEESRMKMIKAHTGKKYSEESKLKMSNTRKKLIAEKNYFLNQPERK